MGSSNEDILDAFQDFVQCLRDTFGCSLNSDGTITFKDGSCEKIVNSTPSKNQRIHFQYKNVVLFGYSGKQNSKDRRSLHFTYNEEEFRKEYDMQDLDDRKK